MRKALQAYVMVGYTLWQSPLLLLLSIPNAILGLFNRDQFHTWLGIIGIATYLFGQSKILARLIAEFFDEEGS